MKWLERAPVLTLAGILAVGIPWVLGPVEAFVVGSGVLVAAVWTVWGE